MREERFPVTTGPGLPIRQLAMVPDSLYSIVEQNLQGRTVR
jgi:hypothetical protein